jgi:outer membrane protein assembly factor BamD (BamD/ComL family)
MLPIIAAALHIVFLFLKNSFEKDAVERRRKEELYDEAKQAVTSGNLSAINAVFDKLRS